jgi:hypothetical protein
LRNIFNLGKGKFFIKIYENVFLLSVIWEVIIILLQYFVKLTTDNSYHQSFVRVLSANRTTGWERFNGVFLFVLINVRWL